MTISQNEKVKEFLENLNLIDREKFEILNEMREIVFNVYPNSNEKIMYGGIIFFLNKEMFSGLFVNKGHITMEFSRGFLMDDPNILLEGKGKYRRHLKIKVKEDILNKKTSFFMRQAMIE